MTHNRWYPGADTTTQPFGEGNVRMPRISKLVLHTTESRDWPGYGGAGGHPTLTYNPWRHEWRQHLPVDGSATTLMDPDSTPVRENRDDVCQVEIVAYCDPNLVKQYGHGIADIDAQAIGDLARFIVWLHREWELPIKAPVLWNPYPKSAGVNAQQRFRSAAYDKYEGILGHQHVSGNAHGDPGAINIDAILNAARTILVPTQPTKPATPTPEPKPTPKPDPKPTPKPAGYPTPKRRLVFLSKLKPGQQNSDSVWWVQKALNDIPLKGGATLKLTGDYDAPTEHEVEKFQAQVCNDKADGKLGPRQTALLFRRAKIQITVKETP